MPLSGLNAIGLADILREQNHLDDAFALVREGIDIGRKVNDYDALREGPITLARLHFARGESLGVRDAIHEAEQIAYETGNPDCLQETKAWKAHLAISTGEFEQAIQWGSERGLTKEVSDISVTHFAEIELLIFSRILILQRNHQRALSLLENLLRSAEVEHRNHSVIQILILQAIALHSLGRREDSIRQMARALLLAEPEGYFRTFIEQDPPITVILRNAAAQSHSPDYAHQLLSALGETVNGETNLDPLSERELEVLQLMAEGLSNPEIAGLLTIALSTAKTHINKIYSKLGVRSRTQAVARAREMKLLP
jgi:LuxR family maltose regulon positive regulatory protein